MRKIFIAVVAVGICFGVTDVEAKSTACPVMKAKADGALGMYDTMWEIYARKREKWAASGASVNNKAFKSLEMHEKNLDERLTEASKWATIYIAFCKK